MSRIKLASHRVVIKSINKSDEDFLRLFGVYKETIDKSLDYEKFLALYGSDSLVLIDFTLFFSEGRRVGFSVSFFYHKQVSQRPSFIARGATGLIKNLQGQGLHNTVDLYTKFARFAITHPLKPLWGAIFFINAIEFGKLCKFVPIFSPKPQRKTSQKVKNIIEEFIIDSGHTRHETNPNLVKVPIQVNFNENLLKRIYGSHDPNIQWYLKQNPLFLEKYGLLVVIPVTYKNIFGTIANYIKYTVYKKFGKVSENSAVQLRSEKIIHSKERKLFMNCLKNDKIEKGAKDFNWNKLVSDVLSNEFLKHKFKDQFFDRLILPGKLISEKDFLSSAEDGFAKAVLTLTGNTKNNRLEADDNILVNSFFILFKSNYHKQLTKKLQLSQYQRSQFTDLESSALNEIAPEVISRDLTNNALAVLKQMSQELKDFFIWFYIDQFSIEQISVITGDPANSTKINLWRSCEFFRNTWKRLFNFPEKEIITEPQYFLFFDYFENRLSDDGEKLLKMLMNEGMAIQENFELELYLRYGLDKVALLIGLHVEDAQEKSLSGQPIEFYQSAEEFIDHVKHIAESSSLKEVP